MRNGSSANPGLVREDEWLNALFGRMFLGAYKTEWARRHLVRKMQAKFDRVHRPVFLDKIIVADLDIGDNVPLITSPKLEAFDTNGMVDISMYVHYMGGFRLVLNTGVKLGSLRMSVSLAVVLESLTGKMLVRLKPSPSNRFWMGFYEMPNIRLSLSPVLMQKKVKYAAVSQAIEKQIYDVLRQTLVLPNMDDTVFFPTFVDDGAILERSLKEYKDLVLGEDEIVLSSDDESEHSGTRRSASSRGKSSQPGSNHGSSHGSEIAPQRQSAQTTSPLDIPGESTNASAQMPSEGRPYSDDDVVWDGNNALSVQESTGSSRLSTASPKQLHDLQSKRSPSPARSISQQAKPASMKSTISLSAASFLKRARDSQAAESAKTWWQTIQQGGSNGGVAGKPPALPTKLVNASSPVIGGDGEGSSGSSDQKQPMPIHPLRPASGMSPRLPRYDELADDYELPLSTSPPSIPAGGSIAQINSTTASGDDSSGALQFPRLADSSVSSGYNSNYLNRGGKPAAPGTDSSLVRRRPAALSTGSDVELPLHSRYSKSNQHH
ncbi:hypothetical protein H4R26_005174 [Coemansia thaxteri]|uniref:SMP-LTD domain-containing protein n=1 Tax=Coemansia thaxteri TaxID=2663907 RepID=A0A9W8ECV0_9FUNG|nr:hypothetical protein H4R26_005174 [Coemansia thaxteri]KAJ2476854.1 hypothetical protein EV174_004796 [Coemansia sp. RSA 2320]